MIPVSKKIRIGIEGMSCVNCAATVTKYLSGNGAQDVHVNFASREAVFRLDGRELLAPLLAGLENSATGRRLLGMRRMRNRNVNCAAWSGNSGSV